MEVLDIGLRKSRDRPAIHRVKQSSQRHSLGLPQYRAWGTLPRSKVSHQKLSYTSKHVTSLLLLCQIEHPHPWLCISIACCFYRLLVYHWPILAETVMRLSISGHLKKVEKALLRVGKATKQISVNQAAVIMVLLHIHQV